VTEPRSHLAVLDGWRGISILLVLAAHLLPLGPKAWRLNEAAALMGMAIFFTLSGFLITSFLLANASISDFLIRRFFRIIPLAWLALLIVFPLAHVAPEFYLPNFLFYANLPPYYLPEITAHFWSLSVEVQFYLTIAIIVGLLGTRGLYLIIILCLAITAYRVAGGAQFAIVTWYRADEILAGGILALIHSGKAGRPWHVVVPPLGVYVLIGLFMISTLPAAGVANYFRPYLAAAMVGSTLVGAPLRLGAILRSGTLRYIAAVSFALYVFHGILANTWLGQGEKLARYLKRPLLVVATFALAHVSTFYYEQRWIAFGRRLSARRSRPHITKLE
jgi:peptidoglycan/LPS O-acetylase OafA/YrhL